MSRVHESQQEVREPIQKLLIQQHEQQEKATALPAVKPAFKKPVANAKKADMQFASLSSAASTKAPSSLEIRCGPVRLTVTEATSSELLKRTLCVLRDVFPAC